jgi:staphylococcal nuclease domain-containing protein 1
LITFIFQVNVQIECSRKVGLVDGSVISSGAADSRVMDFGSVFLLSSGKADSEDAPSPAVPAGQQTGLNVAELIIGRGFGTVIRHRDFEERSNFYDALLAAESRAISQRKGIHSAKDPPVMHITDLTTVCKILTILDFVFTLKLRKCNSSFQQISFSFLLLGICQKSQRLLAFLASK